MSQRLTPVDILNLRFRRSPAGYAISEVDEFVRRVASDMEALLTEGAVHRERLLGQERELAQYRAMEVSLRDALVLAQKTADETRSSARLQAEAILQEAQSRSRAIDLQTQARLEEVKNQIERLCQERRSLARDLRVRLNAHLAWLEEEIDAAERSPVSPDGDPGRQAGEQRFGHYQESQSADTRTVPENYGKPVVAEPLPFVSASSDNIVSRKKDDFRA